MAREAAVKGWAGALLLSALAALPQCTCSRGRLPPEAARDFGDVSAPVPDALPYLRLARAVIDHRALPPAPQPPAKGRRVMLALYRVGFDPVVATANGATLADAAIAAAQAVSARAPDAVTSRIEIDVPTALSGVPLEEGEEDALAGIGLEGLFRTDGAGRTGVVLPGEIVERRLFHRGRTPGLDAAKIAALLDARAGGAGAAGSTRTYRFRADAHVESPAHDAALPVLRGMVVHPASPTPELLLAAVRRGADYLVRMTNAEGRYVYEYDALDDRDAASYGWLRHAGTTYALFEAYEEFGTPAYLQTGERALGYLEAHLRDDPPSQGKYLLDTNDEEQQKVGGAGLALLAFAKDAAVTGKRDRLETMRALARFITSRQAEDGHFRCNADLETPGEGAKRLKREPVYYPGEATLALMRLYAIDPQQAYLDAARRAADWVVNVRDAYVSEDNQEHDHWMSYALNELYRVTRDRAYLEHATKIARAIQRKQHGDGAPAPDLVGTFYEGETTPASTRVEAYDADVVLSRFAGKPDAWLLGPAKVVAASMLGQQYDAADDYWLKDPARADGGVRESLFASDVRIDYVQHAMSAWLHLARILRDPGYGKSGVPSQDPVRPALAAP